MTADDPPRLAVRLLRRALPSGVRGKTILGDLLEDFRGRLGRRSLRALWYWRQTLSLTVRYAWQGERDVGRPKIEGSATMLDQLWQDVRYAARSYAKTPSFTLAVTTTLALGIGASTAIFSAVNAILLQPLPLPEPDRLVYANEVNGKGDFISISWPNYLDWRARAQSFESLALRRDEPLTLTDVERAQRLRAARVTGNLFATVGVRPALGRAFDDDDDRPNAEPVAVVMDAFRRGQMAADPSVLGRKLKLDGTQYTIVGVMPPGFEFPRFGFPRPHDLFVSVGPIAGSGNVRDRGNHNGFSAIGRLRPGVSLEAASRELESIAAALELEYPNTNSAIGVRATPLADQLVSSVRLTLLALLGAVGFLLLIACVNVANLLIARAAARQHELAVRAALGGGRLRLVRQLLAESGLLSIVGCAAGIVVARWLLRVLVAVAPEATPRLETVRIDGAALLFAVGGAVLCGIGFGLFPALQGSGVIAQHVLVRARRNGFTSRSRRVRRGLVVVETALALVLLTGAGLMMRTVQELTHVDTGIRTDHLLTTRFTLAGAQWTLPKRLAFYDAVLARLRALPGVTRVALAYSLPIDGSNWNSIFIVGDQPVPERARLPSAAFTPVSGDYFATMGMRLICGRLFDARETADSPRTVVINETLAKRLWPGDDAIGKRLKQGWPETPETVAPWREVVGVVSDVKMNGVTAETPLQVYLPLVHDGARSLAVVMRTTTDASSLAASVEGAVRELDKDLPLFQMRTMDTILASSMARQRMSMLVFLVFALVALVLASIGLYGVIAHSVIEQTHEIGVRIALGATARDVIGMIVGQGLGTTLIGVLAGLAGATALSASIQGLLFGVRPIDLPTLAGVVLILVTVAMAACYIPARRATRMDPCSALRSD
jgi:predicted permease